MQHLHTECLQVLLDNLVGMRQQRIKVIERVDEPAAQYISFTGSQRYYQVISVATSPGLMINTDTPNSFAPSARHEFQRNSAALLAA